MGRRHIFSLVQLNTSCLDFAPTSQKQRGLNDEAEIKQGRKAWSTRSTSGIQFVPAMASEEPMLLQGCSERGINLCCPWQSCACAFCLGATHCPHQTRVPVLLGKHRQLGDGLQGALWGLLPQRHRFSVGREGQWLCTLPWAILSGWAHRGAGEGWGHSLHGHWCWHGL